jgi:integrase
MGGTITHAKLNCKPGTYERYEGVLRLHLMPTFKTVALTNIGCESVRNRVYHLREKLEPASVNVVVAVLRMILTQAVDDRIISSNPASNIGKFMPKRPQKQRDIQPLTRDELSQALEAIRMHRPAYYPLFLTLARTGMRIGEALALEWGDIDWRGQFIHVQRTYSGRRIMTPKNGRTRRVDMSEQLTAELKRLHTQRKAETLRGQWPDVPQAVFCSAVGTRLEGTALRDRIWYPCLEKAGLRRARIHDIRHTYASILIQQGAPLAYVKDQLGHASISMTVDVYGHLVPGGNREAVNQLDDARESATPAQLRGA